MRIRYAVQCQKHGIESTDYVGRMVAAIRVPITQQPSTKKPRPSGCPWCALETAKARKG